MSSLENFLRGQIRGIVLTEEEKEKPSRRGRIKKGSVGKLFNLVECKTIHPESRRDLSRGETGILCFRGPNIFNGYLNESKKTREVLTRDLWFITGDIGHIDDENQVSRTSSS